MIQVLLLIVSGCLTAAQTCFEQTPVYGVKYSDSLLSSDLSMLRSQVFNTSMVVKEMKVCGAYNGYYMAFEGLQLTLSDEFGNEMELSHIGATYPCDTWVLPQDQWFYRVVVGYDSAGPTYLKAATQKGVIFERGRMKTTDSATV